MVQCPLMGKTKPSWGRRSEKDRSSPRLDLLRASKYPILTISHSAPSLLFQVAVRNLCIC